MIAAPVAVGRGTTLSRERAGACKHCAMASPSTTLECASLACDTSAHRRHPLGEPLVFVLQRPALPVSPVLFSLERGIFFFGFVWTVVRRLGREKVEELGAADLTPSACSSRRAFHAWNAIRLQRCSLQAQGGQCCCSGREEKPLSRPAGRPAEAAWKQSYFLQSSGFRSGQSHRNPKRLYPFVS